MNPDWILPDFASPITVTACGDPAEALARLARMNGCLVLNFLDVSGPEGEGFWYPLDDLTVVHYSRAAFRFAAAAVLLYRHQELNRVVAAGAPEEPDDEPGPEPAYMQALRELAKPWKSELT